MITLVKYATLMLSLIGVFFFFVAAAESQEDEYMSERSALCNTEQANPHDPLLTAIDDLLFNITDQAPTTGPHYGYYTSKTEQGRTAYGYGCCDAGQSSGDCFECLDTCKNLFYEKCGNAVGAQMNMSYCYIRYENYAFM